jgi:hypothetical protein
MDSAGRAIDDERSSFIQPCPAYSFPHDVPLELLISRAA